VHFTPPADPALRVWDVEGRITAYNRANRTITANGMTFTLPATLMVKTLNLDQPVGNIPFADSDPATHDLTDPALEATRTIIGGTAIAGGNTVFTTQPAGTCMSLVATAVFVELAENGIIGPLMAVDVAGGSFVVNGATIRMNTDPRFPSDLLDLGGHPITVADLAGNEGSLVDVGGYYDPAAGVLYGTLVGTEVLQKQVGKDTAIIEKAQGKPGELRVIGLVSRHPDTNLFAASVAIHADTMNAAGTGCTGALLGSAAVDPAVGSFDFRLRNVSPPTSVCVVSPNGGVDDSPVTIR
ncbi:MAG: hypothetical protein HY684_07650, partial [Chloroflexi bacterium]|nr:hypothetical protein [Chloroflexota bacterium]